ncbi:MAG TPA: deoxynucleoside kinase [Myxococcales bacterium]|jgi:deoxyadenosine/deoxycytidine kinase|nr:deoxynucleoside kinase [Myxococcales bacterium]
MSSKKRFIAVAGNMGAGKSELVSFLCRRYGLVPFYEPNDTNPYLADFYKDMSAWAFHSQIYFLTHKFRLHKELMREPGTVVQDRTIYEDAEIFCENLHRRGDISERDYKMYRELYETIVDSLAPPDLMIFLRCPMKTLKKRIAQRGRKMEIDVPTEYLRSLDRLYDEWRGRYSLSPVIELDTGSLDYLTDLVDRLDLFKQIEKYVT